jgi:ketosteroid isomerase-like protein
MDDAVTPADSLSPDELSDPRFRAVVINTFEADRTLDPERFVQGLTEGGSFRLGGQSPVTGRQAIREMLTATFAAFTSVTHRLLSAVEGRDVLAYEAVVTYAFRDGRVVSLPYCNVLHFSGDKVAQYKVYLDLSAMAPAAV